MIKTLDLDKLELILIVKRMCYLGCNSLLVLGDLLVLVRVAGLRHVDASVLVLALLGRSRRRQRRLLPRHDHLDQGLNIQEHYEGDMLTQQRQPTLDFLSRLTASSRLRGTLLLILTTRSPLRSPALAAAPPPTTWTGDT